MPFMTQSDTLPSSQQQQQYHRPAIPLAVLKIQLKKLVRQQAQQQQKEQESIFTRDLIPFINQYEQEEHVNLLTEAQKEAILPFTKLNPDLEMTPDDIIHLLKLVCPPPLSSERPPMPMPSMSEPTLSLATASRDSSLSLAKPASTTKPSSSSLRSSNKRSATPRASWKRRPSAATSLSDHDRQQINRYFRQNDLFVKKDSTIIKNEPIVIEEEEEEANAEYDNGSLTVTSRTNTVVEEKTHYQQHDIAKYYRRSVQLTHQLKSSERSLLASIAQDNEDRIVQLQNKVDDMSAEVTKQKKEIQEYKGKERNSLEQIGALESHIITIQRSETDQRQVYLSIKALFDEKCQEAQKLQDLLKTKEIELQKTEDLLNQFQLEVKALSEERNRLREFQNSLEQELETSAQAHQQLAEQKSENEKLKEIIDNLKMDLDEVLQHQHRGEVAESSSRLTLQKKGSTLSLRDEFERLLNVDDMMPEEEDTASIMSVQEEKDYYKHRADEAKHDLERVKEELDSLRKALQSQNQLLVSELAGLKQTATSPETQEHNTFSATLTVITSHIIPPLSPSSSTKTAAVAVAAAEDFGLPPSSMTRSATVECMNRDSIKAVPAASMTSTIPSVPIATAGVQSAEEKGSGTDAALYSTARFQQERNNIILRGQYHKRRRTVLDLHKVIDTEAIDRVSDTAIVFSPVDSTLPISVPSASDQNLTQHARDSSTSVSRRVMTRQENRVVTQTVTFALYTVLVYFFGIITSTFLLDGNNSHQQQFIEQAIAAASGGGSGSGQSGIIKSKVLELILYWLEKLLIEPEGLPGS